MLARFARSLRSRASPRSAMRLAAAPAPAPSTGSAAARPGLRECGRLRCLFRFLILCR